MKVYLVRHAVAFERDEARWPDDAARPLTPEGEKQFKRVARRLGALFKPPVCVLSSPFARAWRTAEMLHEHASWPAPEQCPALEPGRAPARAFETAGADKGAVIAMVGHEPSLGELAAFMLSGHGARATFQFKKGGAACIEFGGAIAPGAGKLRWLLTPRALTGG
jgi:phosphohistidine phosphatase